MRSPMETPAYNPMYTPLYTPLHRPNLPAVRPQPQYGAFCRGIAAAFTGTARFAATVMHALIRLAVTIGAIFLLCPSTLHGQRSAVAAHALARGVVLTDADIQWSDSARTLKNSDTSATVAAGWVARRAIQTGEALRAPAVSRPDMVASGDPVDVVYQSDDITLRMKGTAVGNGAAGERIYVRLDNRRRLRAVVTGPNTVKVVL